MNARTDAGAASIDASSDIDGALPVQLDESPKRKQRARRASQIDSSEENPTIEGDSSVKIDSSLRENAGDGSRVDESEVSCGTEDAAAAGSDSLEENSDGVFAMDGSKVRPGTDSSKQKQRARRASQIDTGRAAKSLDGEAAAGIDVGVVDTHGRRHDDASVVSVSDTRSDFEGKKSRESSPAVNIPESEAPAPVEVERSPQNFGGEHGGGMRSPEKSSVAAQSTSPQSSPEVTLQSLIRAKKSKPKPPIKKVCYHTTLFSL